MIRLLFTLMLLMLPFSAQAEILDIKEVKSKSGINAWLVEDHTIPVISLQFLFRNAGSANDPADKQGLARVLSNTMDEGAGDLTSEQFQAILADNSISLSFGVDRDDFSGSVRTLTKNKDKAFDLLALSLTKPRFDKDAVDRMVAANLTRIRSDMTDPDWMAARLLNSVIFRGHAYEMNSGGTLSSLPKITSDDLRVKSKRDLTRDRLIVSVTGDITTEELSSLLDKVFADLPAQSPKTAIGNVKLATASSITLYKLDIPQTLIQASLPGIKMDDPDYFAAQIFDFILGSSGFGSRLTEVVREQNGLTYGIYTGLQTMDRTELFNLSTSTKNETAARVLDLTKQEFDRIKRENVSQKEIDDARAYLIGSTPLALTSTSSISGVMQGFQKYNLPVNYLDIRAEGLRKVTAADIKRVANRLLNTSRLSISLVGNPQGVTPTSTVTELPNVK